MASHARDADGRLRSLEEILRFLWSFDVEAAKSTVWLWRRAKPARDRPPIRTAIVGTSVAVVADQADLADWVCRMEAKGFFDRSRKQRATRRRRKRFHVRKAG